MKTVRRWWIAATLGAVLVTLAGAGAVLAQTPAAGSSTTGITMLDRVASKLGIDVGTLRDAVKSSADDDVDAKVASGQLTQAQADDIKQHIAQAPDDALLGAGRHGGPGGPGFGRFADDNLAAFLGVSADQLRTELQASGSTLASVAQAHGKSRDDLKAFLADDMKTRLAQEVADGRLTQAQADARLADQASRLDALIDGQMPPHRGPDDRPFGGPPAVPGSSQAPSSSG